MSDQVIKSAFDASLATWCKAGCGVLIGYKNAGYIRIADQFCSGCRERHYEDLERGLRWDRAHDERLFAGTMLWPRKEAA